MITLATITADRIKDANVLLSKVDLTTGTGDGGVGAAATLKLSSEADKDTSIGFMTRHTSNVALVGIHGAAGVTAGINLLDQASAYAPMASNLALQTLLFPRL